MKNHRFPCICVLVCDEATAALDTEIDDNIQRIMRRAFRNTLKKIPRAADSVCTVTPVEDDINIRLRARQL